ncbi:uncharacterized protein UV8b_01627 [Ustilaginoidea virens]|uniref:FAD-binding FR-type domain-containing protein n=1 Tax=Ustilaginoidea virens TaxID=1159556 RepID=A0A8E5MEJ8_USTVR|nr:uncharacterized protein UV8b_01627 [Ustilaginoidea virens]QUC17386.1 hypothetical protein UV8b_01627 [Ustilaginoidea virens]
MKLLSWLASALCWCQLSRHAAAKASTPSDLCLPSCQNFVRGLPFRDSESSPAATPQLCVSRLAIISVYLCLEIYCDKAASEPELAILNDTCVAAGGAGIPPLSIISNYTAGDIERLQHVDVGDEIPRGQPLTEPAVPSFALYKSWLDTLDAVGYVNRQHYAYGTAMILFWLAVVAFGAMARITSLALRCLGNSSRRCTPNSWLKRHLVLPATFGYKSATAARLGTIPPRIQTLTLLAFALINLFFSMHGYRIVPVNLYFPTRTRQILRYVSDRTGIISFANFPIVWLFGMRNNVAIWLTGWDFGTYNNFHRWVARISTAQAVVHSIGYTVLVFHDGGWEYYVAWWTHQMYWVAGQVATVAMCALVACSIYWLRRRRYELFLVTHICLSIIVLVAMLGHVSIFNGEYDALFWVPVVIWLCDRALRVLRIVLFNPGVTPTTAAATYNPATNMVRLEIPCRSRALKIKPGTHFYLSLLDHGRAWESHPFTVASVTSPGAKTPCEQLPLLDTDRAEAEEQDRGGGAGGAERRARLVTFLIRPFDGFTARLGQLAAAEWPRPASLRVTVDGPYGHGLPLHLFDRVVFVVGGSGVVVPLSYMKALAEAGGTRSVQLHWAVREAAFAAELVSADMAEAAAQTSFDFSVDLYLSAETAGGAAGGTDTPMPGRVARHCGRPGVREIVLSASEAAGSLAVVVCGPAQMADDARSAVVQALGRDDCLCHVDYFEEKFRW